MRRLIFVLVLLMGIGCSTYSSKEVVSQSELENSTGGKSGIFVLDNGDAIYFKSSFVIIDKNTVYISNEDMKHEVKWRRIRTIHLYNTAKQEDYINQLKKIEKINKEAFKY